MKEIINKLLPLLNDDYNNNECIIETLNNDKRILPTKYYYSLFKENGDFNNNSNSKKPISFICDGGGGGEKLYFKFKPQFPLMELAISKFVQLLFGEDNDINDNDAEEEEEEEEEENEICISSDEDECNSSDEEDESNNKNSNKNKNKLNSKNYSILLKSEFAILKSSNKKNHYYPILISKGIKGENLFEIVNKGDPQNKLNNLHSKSLSKLIITSILINPGGGNLSDFIVSPIKGTRNKYKLVSIDNQLSFVPGETLFMNGGLFSSTDISVCVNSVLFMFSQMHSTIHTDIMERILSLDIKDFLNKWVSSISILKQDAKKLVCDENYKKHHLIHSVDDKTSTGIVFPNGSIRVLFNKLYRLQNALKKMIVGSASTTNGITPALPTHWKLLQIVEPLVSNSFWRNNIYLLNSKIMDRYTAFKKDIDLSNNFTPVIYNVSTVKKSRGINKKNKNDIGLQELEFLEMEIQFFKNLIENNHHQLTSTNAESIFKSLKATECDSLFEEYLNQYQPNLLSTDSSPLKKNQITTLLTEIIATRKDLRYLNIDNCSLLSTKILNSFQSIKVLKKLEITNCSQLKMFSRNSIFASSDEHFKFPSLTKLTIHNCPNLKVLNIFALNLNSIDIVDCMELKQYEVFAPKLNKLKLQSSLINSNTLLKMGHTEHIKYIDISNSLINGSSHSLKHLTNAIDFDKWKKLVQFQASNVKSLTTISITVPLPNLVCLQFDGCESLKEIISPTQNLAPLLEILNLTGTACGTNENHTTLFNHLKN